MTRAPALHTTDARGQSDQPSGASPLSDLAARPVDVTLTASREEVRELVDRERDAAKAADALARSGAWLGDANEARERGNVRRAEVCDRKAQFWLDRYNRLIGNGDCARRAGRSS